MTFEDISKNFEAGALVLYDGDWVEIDDKSRSLVMYSGGEVYEKEIQFDFIRMYTYEVHELPDDIKEYRKCIKRISKNIDKIDKHESLNIIAISQELIITKGPYVEMLNISFILENWHRMSIYDLNIIP